MRFIDLTGDIFGRLVVMERAPSRARNVYWWCQCSCGQRCAVMGELLRLGKTSSCGCLKAETYYQIDVKRPAVIDGDIVRIQLTKGLVAIVDLVDADLALFNWCALKGRDTWYAARNKTVPERETILLHREVAKRAGQAIDGLEVDHKNGDGLDCRRDNLKPASRSQNAINTRRYREKLATLG